jgi:hypothetical protein
MATEVTCPDCGGIIGGDPSDPRPACTCSLNLSMDDTEVEAQPPPPSADDAAKAPAPKAGPAKICCQCGKDVTHQKRAKDARGYWCYECHRADLRRERAGQTPRARCPQCGRLVPADSLTTYHGNTLCAKCRIEEESLPKHMQLKYKPKIGDDPKEKEEKLRKEKTRVIVLAAIFGVLALIIILSHIF